MNDSHIDSVERVRQVLEGAVVMEMAIPSKVECYGWIQHTLVRFGYLRLGKSDRGLLLRFLQQVSGYSRAQIKHLVKQYRCTGQLRRRHQTTRGFPGKYTAEHIPLLARLDERHGTLSGPAAKKLCERAFQVFGQAEYRRLAGISVSWCFSTPSIASRRS